MSARTPFFSRWVDQWSELRPALPYFRGIFALWVLLSLVPSMLWLRDAPSAFLRPPPGLPMLFPYPPGPWAVELVNALVIVFALCLLFGKSPRIASLGIAASLLLLDTWGYAYGKINHSIFVIIVATFLALFPWREPTAPSSRGERAEQAPNGAWAVGALAFTIALGMLTAAVPKIWGGWLSPTHSATQYHLLRNHVVNDREGALTHWFLALDVDWLWILADYVTVGLELGFLLALLTPMLFRFACAVAALFHLGVLVTMDIPFQTNVIAYAAFVRWDLAAAFLAAHAASTTSGLKRLREKAKAAGTRAEALALLALAGVVLLAYGFPFGEFSRPIPSVFRPGGLTVWAGGLFAAAYLARLGWRGVRGLPSAWRATSMGSPVLLFDGECNLCNRWVDFVMEHDRGARFRFASLQSKKAQSLLDAHGASFHADRFSSLVLVTSEGTYRESAAVLRTLASLGGIWKMVLAGYIAPLWLRDETYQLVARNRYRWFGRRDDCRLPSPEEATRFL